MRKPMIRTMGTSIAAMGLALSMPVTAAEGLYSMDELLDATVYDNAGEEVGDVEDILLGNDMSVHSLVIETDDVLGMGGRDVVAERGSFTVRMKESSNPSAFDEMDYEVHMQGTSSELKNLPEYNQSWWNQTSDGLQQAWENTKDISESAWENTKEATSSAWYNIKDGAEQVSDNIRNATE